MGWLIAVSRTYSGNWISTNSTNSTNSIELNELNKLRVLLDSISPPLQDFSKSLPCPVFPMDQLDGSRLFGHGGDPVDEALLVGVGGVAGQGVDAGRDGFAFSVEDDIAVGFVGIRLDVPAGGAGGLVADEENVVFRLFDAILQMIDDPAASAHAAAGQDDGGAVALAELQMVPVVFHRIQAVEIDGMVPPLFQIAGLLVPVFREPGIDPGDLQPQG